MRENYFAVEKYCSELESESNKKMKKPKKQKKTREKHKSGKIIPFCKKLLQSKTT